MMRENIFLDDFHISRLIFLRKTWKKLSQSSLAGLGAQTRKIRQNRYGGLGAPERVYGTPERFCLGEPFI